MKRAALLLCLIALPAARQDDPFETRIYNVEFLTRAVQDRPGIHFGLTYDAIGTSVSGGAEYRSLMPADTLVDLIKANIAEDSWQHASSKIDVTEGGLGVTNRKSTQAKIAQYLEYLRSTFGKLITLDAAIVSADPAFLAKLRAAGPADRPATLAAEQARQLLDAAREGKQAELVKSLRITAHPGQHVHLQEGVHHAYLRDHDVQIATSAVALDPVMDVFTTGAGFDIEAYLEPFGNTVTLEVRADASELEAMEERKLKLLGLVPAAGQEAKPADAAKDVVHAQAEARVQLPRVTHDWLRTNVTARSGETIILGTAFKKGRTLAFLVTPAILALDDKPAPEPVFEEQRLLRLYDVSPLTRPIQDFRAPSTELVSPSKGGGGPLTGATFSLDEPRERMSTVQLEDMIKTHVAPESWGNKRNSIKGEGGRVLVVRQKPEILKEIERYLNSFILQRSQVITTEAVAIAFKKGARADWEKEIPALLPGGYFADEEKFAKLFEEAAKGVKVRIAAIAEITGYPQQRVHVGSLVEESYIEKYEPQVSTAAAQFDPIIGVLQTGFVLDASPAFIAGNDRILVPLKASLTSREMKEIETVSSGVGPVQVPRVTGPRWESDAVCAKGKWTLVAIETRGTGDAMEDVALFVRARANLLK
jgi:hypothetical protein